MAGCSTLSRNFTDSWTERSCEQKGSVYYMALKLDRSVAPTSVVGINFQSPTVIPNANRCKDVVDLIYG